MDYEAIRRYFPWANAAYGQNDTNNAPIPVGNSQPVVVKGFEATSGSAFDGALYKDATTGRYTLAFAGSVQKEDWIGADPVLAGQTLTSVIGVWAGSWHPQLTDALNFTYEAIKQIRVDLINAGKQTPTMDDIRAVLDVTGHSLGGAQAEMVAKLLGIPGANIDGPGVTTLVSLKQYTDLRDKLVADPELIGMQSN